MSNSRECDDGGKQAQHVNFLRVIEIATYQFVGKITLPFRKMSKMVLYTNCHFSIQSMQVNYNK